MQENNLAHLDSKPDKKGEISIRDNAGIVIVTIPRCKTDEETINKAELIYQVYFENDFFIHDDGSELSQYFNTSVKID